MSDSQVEREPLQATSRWTPVYNIEPKPDVVILFHGLMCFCNNDEGYCEVGIHKKAKHHNFNISVFELTSDTFDPPHTVIDLDKAVLLCTYDRSDTGDSEDDEVVFAADTPKVIGVSFYQSKPPKPPKTEPNDFLFIVDLEGNDFYKGHVDKKTDAFGPMLHIPNAVFYTMCKSCTQFKREATNDVLPIGSVALVMAANIYLAAGGQLTLKMKSEDVPLKPEGNKKYVVVVSNGCPPDVCKFDGHDNENKEHRNDFFQYFKTFKIPDGKKEFELKIDEKGIAADGSNPCSDAFRASIANVLDQARGKRIADDTPCGASGFGSSGCIHC